MNARRQSKAGLRLACRVVRAAEPSPTMGVLESAPSTLIREATRLLKCACSCGKDRSRLNMQALFCWLSHRTALRLFEKGKRDYLAALSTVFHYPQARALSWTVRCVFRVIRTYFLRGI
jgi:hypothetical protein